MSMNIEEMKRARAAAAAKITEILRELEADTGLRVAVVGMDRDYKAGPLADGRWLLRSVEIETSVPQPPVPA